MPTTERVIQLAHCKLAILGPFRVDVRFPDGKFCPGERLPTRENLDQAKELGYPETEDGVSQALIDHELLHCLVGEIVFDGKSPTLWHEAQGEYAPYWLRLYEESIVLALQLWLHGWRGAELLRPLRSLSPIEQDRIYSAFWHAEREVTR